MPGNRRFQLRFALLDTLIPTSPERHGLLAMRQRLRLADIAGMTRCANTLREVAASDGMHPTRVRPPRLCAPSCQSPIDCLPALVQAGVAFARWIFGRGRRGDQRGVNNRAFAQEQAFLGQVAILFV